MKPLVSRSCKERVLPTLARLCCESAGAEIMAQKAEILYFEIFALKTPAALILKQEALSLGAELALPKEAILGKVERVDALLIVSLRTLPILLQKIANQPFGLRALADTLRSHCAAAQKPPKPPKIMGVINLTPDSFYAQSRVQEREALERITTMMRDGADIIDIGAASSRPGSGWIDPNEERARVAHVFAESRAQNLAKDAIFSVDSYTPEIVALALESGFSIINDINGMRDPQMRALAAQSGACVVLMHIVGSPETMQQNPHYAHVLCEVDSFFEQQIALLREEGFGGDIILDVGIGFGKRVQDNLDLIAGLAHFAHHQMPLLVGASRKSLIGALCGDVPAESRLAGTLALHLCAVRNGAAIVRCHDVKEHKQAFAIEQALGGIA